MPSSSLSSGDDDSAVQANVSNESTPLLATINPAPIASAEPVDSIGADITEIPDEDASFNRLQVLLLCYTRVVEPIAFFSIFPYINSMIEHVGGVEKEDVGFYSGLIESLFSATQMCVMMFWGKAADRFGRKPPLVVSLFGVTAATALFGMSKNLWQVILFRCIAGIFAGTVVTVRAMITENCTKATQAKAFSWFAFSGNLGIFIGPFLGGALESPARKFPGTFGHVKFFVEYPYALPAFATAFVGLTAAVITTFFVKETLHIHQNKKTSGEASMSTWELIKHPGVPRVILIYNYIMLLAFAFTAVNPVFLYTPVHLGGIGFSPELIAASIGLAGLSQAAWLLFVFPRLHRRIGTGGVLNLCATIWPLFFVASPICNILLRYKLKIPFWILGVFGTSFGSMVAMAFTAVQLAVNDIAPTHETYGTLNAVVLALSSGLRAIIPAASSSLFAIGVKYHIAWGQLFWIVIILVAMGLSGLLWLLPEKKAGKAAVEQNGEV